MPGSRECEAELIEQALMSIATLSEPEMKMHSRLDLFTYLLELCEQAEETYKQFLPNLILRPAQLRYSVSKGRSRISAKKIMQIYSLYFNGRIKALPDWGQPPDLLNLLIKTPTLRLDHLVLPQS